MVEFSVDKALQTIRENKTDAEREKFEKFQKEQRRLLTERIEQDTFGQNLIYGRRQQRLAEARVRENLPDDEQAFELERLAEAYFLQGQIDEAIGLTTNEIKKKEYLAVRKAIKQKPDSVCECRTEVFLKSKVLYYGQKFAVYACPLCGFLNAKPM